ncbi:MAG TPA: hypothetical protein VGO73_05165 [Pyrinomonadaceae bacterium]|jgi:hypothetical protein|nr:hypothetical protein [Pyrinomonadaceae bacterium]
MEKVIELLNRMQAEGVIENFAIGGGIAAIYYLEPYNTDDIDVFISPVVVSQGGLVSFGRIYTYLQDLGYHAEREYIRIEDWLVQFLPAAEPVQEEAVAQAKRVKFAEGHTLIFSLEHLAAELLRSGRPKDHSRVVALLESDQMEMKVFRDIIRRNDLDEKWRAFASRFDQEV